MKTNEMKRTPCSVSRACAVQKKHYGVIVTWDDIRMQLLHVLQCVSLQCNFNRIIYHFVFVSTRYCA